MHNPTNKFSVHLKFLKAFGKDFRNNISDGGDWAETREFYETYRQPDFKRNIFAMHEFNHYPSEVSRN